MIGGEGQVTRRYEAGNVTWYMEMTLDSWLTIPKGTEIVHWAEELAQANCGSTILSCLQ